VRRSVGLLTAVARRRGHSYEIIRLSNALVSGSYPLAARGVMAFLFGATADPSRSW